MSRSSIPLLVVIAVIVLLFVYSDSISEAEFWNSMFWTQYKIPIIIAAVVAVMGTILLLTRRADEAHARAVEAHAQKRGWSYARHDDQSMSDALEAIATESTIHPLNIRTVRAKPPIYLFDCTHRIPSTRKNQTLSTGCFIPAKGLVASFLVISPRSVLDGVLTKGQIDTGDRSFEEEFVVEGKDRDDALRIATPEVRRLLTEGQKGRFDSGLTVHAGPNGIFILPWTSRWAEDESEIDALAELAVGIASAVDGGGSASRK